jgi:hypothetical protein
MSAFDVWVVRFEPGETSPAERLQKAFGLDASSATALEQSVPKVVKHAVAAKAAGEMRQALEAIGAVVECRPARPAKASAEDDAPAVFRAPDPDLVLPGRISAIDPFAPDSNASRSRISVDQAVPAIAHAADKVSPEAEPPRRIAASLLETSRAQQRRTFIRQAVATMLAGGAIIGIGWFLGNSVFRGEANWVGVGFDGLGIYFVGVGLYDFITTWRS